MLFLCEGKHNIKTIHQGHSLCLPTVRFRLAANTALVTLIHSKICRAVWLDGLGGLQDDIRPAEFRVYYIEHVVAGGCVNLTVANALRHLLVVLGISVEWVEDKVFDSLLAKVFGGRVETTAANIDVGGAGLPIHLLHAGGYLVQARRCTSKTLGNF